MRRAGFDYRTAGPYFITVCTLERKCTLGCVVANEVALSRLGEIVKEEWVRTGELRSNIALDVFVVMPNHFHAIVWIGPNATETDPLPSLSRVVSQFKAATTRRARVESKSPALVVWQRSFFDRILRDERDITNAHDYIVSNPAKWAEDRENPERR